MPAIWRNFRIDDCYGYSTLVTWSGNDRFGLSRVSCDRIHDNARSDSLDDCSESRGRKIDPPHMHQSLVVSRRRPVPRLHHNIQEFLFSFFFYCSAAYTVTSQIPF